MNNLWVFLLIVCISGSDCEQIKSGIYASPGDCNSALTVAMTYYTREGRTVAKQWCHPLVGQEI